jgi:small neutral amino acid transporter SnatA (MarC family)
MMISTVHSQTRAPATAVTASLMLATIGMGMIFPPVSARRSHGRDLAGDSLERIRALSFLTY